ncbi:hypothetical protein BC833DRAFT_604811 [Globomyces pollinis-pini]|nr:hypothetical protein BC833DRAFT_604811 [Globomyces pollinis-pini]
MLEYLSRFNHLVHHQNYLIYFVDNDLYAFDTLTNTFKVIFQAPTIVDLDEQTYFFPPSILFVNGNIGIIATGKEPTMYLIEINDTEVSCRNQIDLSFLPSIHHPTVLQAEIFDGIIFVLVVTTEEILEKDTTKRLQFCLSLVNIPLVSPSDIKCIGQIYSSRLPFQTLIKDNCITVISEYIYRTTSNCNTVEILETKPNENNSTTLDVLQSQSYIWTQTSEDITIHFELPVETTKSNLSVQFQFNQVYVQIKNTQEQVFGGILFDSVAQLECIWTLEKSKYLTLYLTKLSKNVRWMHLFQQDDGVLETLDSATLQSYTDRLEKYTGINKDETLKQVLAFTEATEAVDFDLQSCSYTMFSFKGNTLEPIHTNTTSGLKWLCNVTDKPSSFCLQCDVDGAIFNIVDDPIPTRNIETFPALGYIRNSKRDISIITLSTDFSISVMVESKRYLYIYKNPKGAKTSTQYLYDMCEDGDQSFVKGIYVNNNVIWVLKETRLVKIEF